jgi:hypothetical protein
MSLFSKLFIELDTLLRLHRPLWQFQPMQADWPAELDPALTTLLQQFSLEDCARIDASPELQQRYFAAWFAQLFAALPALPQETAEPGQPLPFWLSTDISGRKWQQITKLAASAGQPGRPVLEWCAGKGHLGKVMSFLYQAPVTSLEWQQSLCDAGQQRAAQLGLAQQFVCVDVLKQPVMPYLQSQQQLLALHACGDLHRVAAREAVTAGCQALALVPCCYHLQQALVYQPLSGLGRQSPLQLSKADLRLAVQQSCTGGERVARLSQTEMLWRQLWRLWRQQQGLGYQPLRSVSKHWFSGDVADFLAFAGAEHQLPAPDAGKVPALLQQAERALLQQRQLELIQHLFRRPLELWLVADLALYLQEQGYQVQLSELCAASLTPRNLLLQAVKNT